jgi:3',5'-cyclic AMP phosphodiesterase CpdA
MVAAVAATADSMPPAEGKSRLRIAHLGDPQFGFITGRPSMKHRAKERFEENYRGDLERLERALARVNELKPDLVVFGGDMTQNPADLVKEWPSLLKRLQVPFVVTPGNHDMGNRLTFENLERFRKVFGRDRAAVDVKGWRVIAGNSQFWHKTEAKDEQAEYEAWVKAELEEAKSRNGRVILATHIPPFAFASDEKNSYDNYPLAGRAARLEAYAASGARFFLTAHLHRLSVRGYKDLTMLGVEALCANFDARPPGFRLLEVADDFSYSWNFIAI